MTVSRPLAYATAALLLGFGVAAFVDGSYPLSMFVFVVAWLIAEAANL